MLLNAEQLGKKFGGLHAVQSVDFSVEAGTITAIIGPNGAGKSTFFNLISGFHRPSSGRVWLDGENITGAPPHRTARLGMARTFQMTHLFEDSTVLDNVIVGHRVRTKSNFFDAVLRTPRARREELASRERALEVLEFVGASHLAHSQAGSITQEARKRVSIALALATDPRIVLLDEPAAGINDEETGGLGTLIRTMVDHGYTICLVEHKMGMVMGLADRIMVLEHGVKIADGAPAAISSDERVVEAYLGMPQEGGDEDA